MREEWDVELHVMGMRGVWKEEGVKSEGKINYREKMEWTENLLFGFF